MNSPKASIDMTTQDLNNRLNAHKYKKVSTALHEQEKNLKHEFDFKEICYSYKNEVISKI